MRSSTIRLPLLVVSVCLGSGLSVWAMELRYDERVYVLPTTAEVVVPASYVPASYVAIESYFLPSAMVVPSYYPTAFVADAVALPTTTYVEMQYRRSLIGSLLFGRRRLVERSVISSYPSVYVPSSLAIANYYPTTYYSRSAYVPTVLDSAVAWNTSYTTASASLCCEEVVPSYISIPSRQAPAVTSPGSSAGSSSRRVESNAMEESIPSYVPPARAESNPTDLSPADDFAKDNPVSPPRTDDAASPPPTPVPKPAPGKATGAQSQPALTQPSPIRDTGKPAEKAKIAAPKAPSGEPADDGLQSAPKGASTSGTGRRVVVAKPVYPLSTIRPERRNVLFGKVESAVAGDPEGEVRVIVSSRTNRGIRHEGMSDAFGRFAIKLLEGDWTVNVTMPSGRIYPVSQITVTDGRIIDQREGREVPSLIITR